jgi:hypothetical protein
MSSPSKADIPPQGRDLAALQLVLTVLPMSGHVGTRFIQMNMLVYMIYPRKRDEVMVLTVW